MKKKILLIFVSVLLVAGLILAGCAKPAPAPAEPIKIGVATCYAGPPGIYGQEATNGFELAVNEINAAGGVLGTTIEFTTRDTKFDPAVALTAVKELIMAEQVDIVVGGINSAAALAMSDYCKGEKVPYFVWSAQSSTITGEKGHRYVFSCVPNNIMWSKGQATYDARQPYTKYWLGAPDFVFGHDLADVYWATLKALKPEVELIGESWWKKGEADFGPYMSAILAAKPEALIAITSAAEGMAFLKAAAATGLAEKVHISAPVMTTDMLTVAPEGILGSLDYYDFYPDTPANRTFVKNFYDAYEKKPAFCAFSAYISAYFIAAALEKAGTVDTEKFIDAVEGIKIDSPVGEIEMRAYDHQAILPIFVGVTTKLAEGEGCTLTDLVTIPGKDVMPTIEEIKKARGES